LDSGRHGVSGEAVEGFAIFWEGFEGEAFACCGRGELGELGEESSADKSVGQVRIASTTREKEGSNELTSAP
jgi:hypothetical protein